MANSNGFDVVQTYRQILGDPDMSTPVATFKALAEFMKHSSASTMSEFMQTLDQASQQIKAAAYAETGSWSKYMRLTHEEPIQYQHKAQVAALAGMDLFLRFVARNSHDILDFETCKQNLIDRSELILQKAAVARDRAAATGAQFIRDNGLVLVHAYSRVLMRLLMIAGKTGKRFRVLVTEGRPTTEGERAVRELTEAGIEAQGVLDSAVAYIMNKVDMVLVGAEGVVENGGVINQIGSYQVALVAKAHGKPLYAVAESYKFVRLFPLSQYDLPTKTPRLLNFADKNLMHPLLSAQTSQRQREESTSSVDLDVDVSLADFVLSNPSVDYTPPEYITLLLTDLGNLTPSGVSDELIKLYL
ncbi:hypothetical protein BZG36_02344 [Bifiguratus adelaidae]|uniref:Translation initiation factor eIF2B subunit alpha n=1 Tax=Bifiguratus adelaidae TaxID=1938954 RepID=A0A261Y2I7_9FUNG|nr:hypothetical protein BZG36_02344 [Bifiguratus adelaidae]